MAGAAQQIAPGMTRGRSFGIPFNPPAPASSAQSRPAPSLRVEVNPVNVRDAGEIELAVSAFVRRSEWRPDRDRQRGRGASSRSDHYAGCPAQAARGLLRTLLRRRRRPDLLWG